MPSLDDRSPVECDVLVVGAGPTGLYAAYYAGFRGLTVAILDSLPEPGGQVSAMYPEKLILDVAGFPAVRGRELVAGLLAQAAASAPTFLLGRQARSLTRRSDGRLQVTTDTDDQVLARAIVLAGGIGTFAPRPLPGAERWLGRGVEHFVPQPAAYAGRDVVVVGGGDSALDWAVALAPVATRVRVVHRRDVFRAHAGTLAAARAAGVELLTPYVVREVVGDDTLTGVVAQHVKDRDDLRPLSCDAVVAALGFTADLGPLEAWGIEIVDRRIVVDSRMQTSVAGVYAAGDITDYPGKVRLIAVGFGEAATAVNNAAVAIDPTLDLFPGHSTDAAADTPDDASAA